MQSVIGSRRLSNILLAFIVTIGGFGFVIASLSSRLGRNILPILHADQLAWSPQGLVMGIYGLLALILSLYLWFVIIVDLGAGCNHFDKSNGVVTISRQGLFKTISIEVPISDIKAVKIDVREGLSPIRKLSLRIQGRTDLTLTSVGQPMALSVLESSGATLARFLNVPLEGI